MSGAEHLTIAPIVLPLAFGAALLLLDERRHATKAVVSIFSFSLLLLVSIALLAAADAPATAVYRLGAWPAPFGIVLVADRLSAAMVLLTAILGLAALIFSLARWHRAGPRFHALLHFLLMGLNGAFLTGDVFNLFVFFELLLAASYGLALHGSGTQRVRASLHYIVVNLTASFLFLIGASLLYGVAGTLNMADLALRAREVAAADRALLEAGAAILGIAFLVKAGMWPLGFWLPGTYAAAAAPAAAMFTILSKVGIYAVLRVGMLLFGEEGGGWIGFEAGLVYGGLATLTFGMIGVLAAQQLSHIAGFSLLVSAGTLLAAVGFGRSEVTGAALYYLVVSTLAVSALYLLIELVERAREPGADMLAVTAEAFGDADAEPEPEEEIGLAIPAAMALLGLSFGACALLLAGLPPFPGFLAKFSLLSALLAQESIAPAAWVLLALLVASGLAATIAMGRAGVRIFWAAHEHSIPRVRLIEMAPVALLLALCISLSLQAGAVMRYFQDTAAALHAPRVYVEEVMAPR